MNLYLHMQDVKNVQISRGSQCANYLCLNNMLSSYAMVSKNVLLKKNCLN